jgi:hypothetical protein
MATNQEIEGTLVKIASRLRGRALTKPEEGALVDAFKKATGRPKDRLVRALSSTTGANEQQIREKAAASDDTNRVFLDLLDALEQ